MRKSIFLKIFGGYLSAAVAMAALILAFTFGAIRSYHIDATAENLKHMGFAMQETVIPLLVKHNVHELNNFVRTVDSETGVRITVVAPDGTVLADSEENPAAMVNHRTRTEIAQVLEGGTGRFLRLSETLKEEMLYIALPLRNNGQTIGVLRLSRFLRAIDKVTVHLKARILQVTVAVVILSVIFSLWFAGTLARPVRKLGEAAAKVARRDFNVRVFLRGNDELKGLADTFNYMVREIKSLFTELSRQKEELNSIIGSLREGLLVLDRDERVLLFNESFEKVAGQSVSAGQFYWEAFREPRFSELLTRVRRTRHSSFDEIATGDRIYLCSATFLADQEEIAVVFHDITGMKDLERIKTDFVANVSHELRTPLTSIKGFLETLEDESVSEDARRYLSIIKRNTDRLIHIISDLLLLSELEDKALPLQVSAVDLKDLIERTARIFEQRLKEKGLSFTVVADPGMPPVMADAFKLEQVFINLVDNAMKHTDEGGIIVSVKAGGGNAEIVVADTGKGISKEHIPRIFERFYVADTSRSKKLGGTGLGLSIVKHVVLLHRGRIDVESKPEQGTRFIVTIPLNL
jgi:two-component system phosphate regulon sensor histidine kinase PhoR